MPPLPPAPTARPPNPWLVRAVALVAAVAVIAGVVAVVRHYAKERRAIAEAIQEQNDPRVLQERALAEAHALRNVELIVDDGSFFPVTGDIETGSLLYTVHEIGPEKKRYYSEDAFLFSREKDLFVVRPILDRPSSGGNPQSYRGRQSRSAETKREEVKAQKKLTLAEFTEKYAARAGK